MITNDFSNKLQNFMNRGSKSETDNPADVMKRLKAKQDAIRGVNTEPVAEETEESAATLEKARPNYLDSYTKSKDATAAAAQADEDDDLSPEEKRQKALQKIMDKLDEEEAQKYPRYATQKSTTATTAANGVLTADQGLEGFLNDLPLFNEFKTGLMDAFKSMDSGTHGYISAQYELNYSSMQTIALAGGGYEYQETTVNLKFDLNYVKAAAGGMSGSDIAKALEGATDFDSLMNALEAVGNDPGFNPTTPPKLNTDNLVSSMKDYFSPEKTAERILDFATAFFPLSEAYKKGGDTEESRAEFAAIMRKAVQKGFDQALGTLGAIPKETREGIDKTHDLVFKGFDDFVKNGMKRDKQDTYQALQQFSFNFEMSATQKSVSVYNTKGETRTAQPASSLDAQA